MRAVVAGVLAVGCAACDGTPHRGIAVRGCDVADPSTTQGLVAIPAVVELVFPYDADLRCTNVSECVDLESCTLVFGPTSVGATSTVAVELATRTTMSTRLTSIVVTGDSQAFLVSARVGDAVFAADAVAPEAPFEIPGDSAVRAFLDITYAPDAAGTHAGTLVLEGDPENFKLEDGKRVERLALEGTTAD